MAPILPVFRVFDPVAHLFLYFSGYQSIELKELRIWSEFGVAASLSSY
jgi:hypothetical protein